METLVEGVAGAWRVAVVWVEWMAGRRVVPMVAMEVARMAAAHSVDSRAAGNWAVAARVATRVAVAEGWAAVGMGAVAVALKAEVAMGVEETAAARAVRTEGPMAVGSRAEVEGGARVAGVVGSAVARAAADG